MLCEGRVVKSCNMCAFMQRFFFCCFCIIMLAQLNFASMRIALPFFLVFFGNSSADDWSISCDLRVSLLAIRMCCAVCELRCVRDGVLMRDWCVRHVSFDVFLMYVSTAILFLEILMQLCEVCGRLKFQYAAVAGSLICLPATDDNLEMHWLIDALCNDMSVHSLFPYDAQGVLCDASVK